MSDPLWKLLLEQSLTSKQKKEPKVSWPPTVKPYTLVPAPQTLGRLPSPPPVLPPIPTRAKPRLNLAVSKARIRREVQRTRHGKITTFGRVLPSLDALGLSDGRQLRAAIFYSDLRGFTNLVTTSPSRSTLVVLSTFVSEMSRIAAYFKGEVVDCAGDRILVAFWRSAADMSVQPIHDAVTCAFWMQTVMSKAMIPELASKGYAGLSCGIGIDYGTVVVARVGIRNRNKLVFLGTPAVRAAKLEESAAPGQVLISPLVFENRPNYLNQANGWELTPVPLVGRAICYCCNQIFSGQEPPKH